MSVDTKAALDAAIEAHIRDTNDGAIITGYVMHASYLNTDLDSKAAHGYYGEFAENQPYHVGLGLAHQLVDHYQVIWEDDEDDESE